jgi:hypothetical protein
METARAEMRKNKLVQHFENAAAMISRERVTDAIEYTYSTIPAQVVGNTHPVRCLIVWISFS